MHVTENVRRWVEAPVFQGDSERTRLAGLLNLVIISGLMLTLLLLIGAGMGRQLSGYSCLLAVSWCVFLMASRRFMHSGRITLVSFCVCLVFFILLTDINISLGTPRTPMTSVYVFWVILTGMLFHFPGILVAIGASAMALLGLILAENADLLPSPNYHLGITHWFSLSSLFAIISSMLYYRGNVLGQALTLADQEIARRKLVEIELQKLTCMVEQTSASIVLADLSGTIEYVNPSFCKITGYSSAEVIGKNARLMQSGKTALSTYQQLWATLLAGHEWQGELLNRKKDGTLFYEWSVISPITDGDGQVTHYLGVKEDITVRKQAEAALRVSENRLRVLADNTRDVVWTMAPDCSLSYVSPSVLAVRGFTQDEAIQQTLGETFAASSLATALAYFSQLPAHVALGLPLLNFQGELEYLCKDGSSVWTDVMAYPIVNDEGVAEILGVTRDITERKRRRVELENESRRLEDQVTQLDRQRTLGQMSAALGHELNQPLTAVLTNAQVLQRGLRMGLLEPVQVEEYLEKIVQNTRRTSDIIERIRTYIRPKEMTLVLLDLQQVVLDTLDLVGMDAQQHKVLVIFDYQSDPVWVKGDVVQLSQVLLNVLRNAIEALQQVAQREIEVQIVTTRDQVKLTVTDTGPGLTPQAIEKIGTPFFSTKNNGLGLGLAISQNIMRNFQGSLRLTNADAGGARVTLTLPSGK